MDTEDREDMEKLDKKVVTEWQMSVRGKMRGIRENKGEQQRGKHAHMCMAFWLDLQQSD